MHKIGPSSAQFGDFSTLRQDLMGKSNKIQFFSRDTPGYSVVGMYINTDGSQVFLSLGVDEARIIGEILGAREMFKNETTPAQALAE